ncbi:TatD family hydrolase [Lacimicrobium sp. SS2-24]|uniref:TatD family hydrolase n=1 Tax=Lacimicrobium sp. SS2-24 TaxID=2005569 RepID=UPI000B4BD790|nr:TatD family hydrolase [Lacimicrobium sp. SS2-24]
MFDSHCHLDFTVFDDDRIDVIRRATDLGVDKILIPGVQASSWYKLTQLCNSHPTLEYALGLHPWFLEDFENVHLDQLEDALRRFEGQVRAVGEIGLDFSGQVVISDYQQERIFCDQLALATQYQLPVIVHHRKSHHRILHCLKACNFRCGGVIHGFSGSLEQAEAYLKWGFKLGIGGTITYPRAQKTRNTVASLPLQSIVLETDAPDMPINGRQGQRNSPEYLPEILAVVAELRGESVSKVEADTDYNALQLFGLS